MISMIIKQNKTFYCSCSHSKHNEQWSASCEYPRPLFLPHQTQESQRTEQSPTWDAKLIMKGELIFRELSKSSMDSFYQSFRSLFTNHLEVHSSGICFCGKGSCPASKIHQVIILYTCQLSRLQVENFDLMPAHACGPISDFQFCDLWFCG